MKTALLIINYNDYKTTKKLIDQVKSFKNLDSIIIVDNKSTDESYQKLKKINDKKINVIQSEENRGYSSGINVGAKYAIEKYKVESIIISNSDIIIQDEKDIDVLLEKLQKKNIAIAAPTILEKGKKNRGWKNPSPLKDILLNIPFISSRIRPKLLFYKEKEYNKDFTEVDVISGCFFLIKSSLLKKIGYLDENTFLYYEENILANQIKKLSMKSVIVNKVEVIHNHSVTIDKNINRLNKFKILKESQYYFHKNYNKANKLELCLLKITEKIPYYILSIVCKIKN